jgi:uncharacterized repeat protein (TIGR03803 family)
MTKKFLRLSRTWWQGRNRVCLEKLQRTLCGLLVLVVSGCGGGGGGSIAQPAPPTVTAEFLYSFGGTPTDAIYPSGVLFLGSDGNFYGTTYRGGLLGCYLPQCDNVNSGEGTVFKITPTGEETVLYYFAGEPFFGDGDNPQILIQGSDGNFYGTTDSGGANGFGTVFKLAPGGQETILYSFKPLPDGQGGEGLVQGSDGNFYGTTDGGGANGFGTVFKLTPEGVETVLYSFVGTSNGGADGVEPVGQLVQGSDGNFYGVTLLGGLPSTVATTTQYGTVFKVTLEGVETILHRFSGPDGQSPEAGLIQGSDGNFYGTTEGGTTSFGTVFEVTPEGVETTLHTFTATDGDGASPEAQLTQGGDGNFYGTTSAGGKNKSGTMFQLTPAGVLTVLYSFPTFPNATYQSSSPETNLVQGSDGNFYGAAYYGGAYDFGYFFKLIVQ